MSGEIDVKLTFEVLYTERTLHISAIRIDGNRKTLEQLSFCFNCICIGEWLLTESMDVSEGEEKNQISMTQRTERCH